MSARYGIGMALVRPIALALQDLGEDGASFLAAVGANDETAVDAFVPADAVDAALEAIAERRGDAAFGLTLCRASANNALGFFGHLVWLSSTLRQSLERASRFYAIVTQRVFLEVEEHRDGTATLVQRLRPGAERGTVLTEFAAGTVALRYRTAMRGRFKIHAVHFMHTLVGATPHEAFFDAPVTFGEPLDQIVFDASALDVAVATADPLTTTALETEAAKMVSARPAEQAARSRAFLKAKCGVSSQDATLILLVAAGRRNKEIAAELQLTEGTVKQYLSRLYETLGVRSRTELALLANDVLRHAA
jgi:DNA-binding CsgD family transcriptional regulator